jgi:malate dehydrogenase
MKAVVLGASGGIGQPLSLLLKINPLITHLSLYDIVNTPGVAADLSHIATEAIIEGYLPEDKWKAAKESGKAESGGLEGGLGKCLKGADIVVIPAGLPRKPGVSGLSLFFIEENF